MESSTTRVSDERAESVRTLFADVRREHTVHAAHWKHGAAADCFGHWIGEDVQPCGWGRPMQSPRER